MSNCKDHECKYLGTSCLKCVLLGKEKESTWILQGPVIRSDKCIDMALAFKPTYKDDKKLFKEWKHVMNKYQEMSEDGKSIFGNRIELCCKNKKHKNCKNLVIDLPNGINHFKHNFDFVPPPGSKIIAYRHTCWYGTTIRIRLEMNPLWS
jgi:hypothetical protein